MFTRACFFRSDSTTYQRAERGVGVSQHDVLCPRVVLPPVDRLQVHRAELPVPDRILQPGAEALQLFGVGDGEPVLAQHDAVLDQHPLEDRGLRQEPVVLLLGAEAHHSFDPGAVVPGPVEQHDLALRGQVLDVALEVPLAPLALGRAGQRGDPGDPGLRYSVIRLIVPPLPAASRPSKITTIRAPVARATAAA